MKTSFKLFGLLMVFATAFSSCSDDDDNNEIVSPAIKLLKEGKMNGKLSENYTLDANTEYQLTGSFIIEEGAVLTIPAGTNIVADAKGTDVYIAVMMGAKINIKGTEQAPVVMTSKDGKPGDWGGLTICGKAETTEGEKAEAEVGGFIYGGKESADSSGSIEYLTIKGTGASINANSEYNGISFYAVGSGTKVNNIAVLSGSDDGVEFFGGSVNASNIYLQNLDDDACDWTEGWNGTVTNIYVVNNAAGFSTAFEADGDNNNPKFNNVTCISKQGGIALQFKKESGCTFTNLYLSGYEVDVDFPQGGAKTNVIIEGAQATGTAVNENEDKIKLNSGLASSPTVELSSFDWVQK